MAILSASNESSSPINAPIYVVSKIHVDAIHRFAYLFGVINTLPQRLFYVTIRILIL